MLTNLYSSVLDGLFLASDLQANLAFVGDYDLVIGVNSELTVDWFRKKFSDFVIRPLAGSNFFEIPGY
jgi:hypothetical protein